MLVAGGLVWQASYAAVLRGGAAGLPRPHRPLVYGNWPSLFSGNLRQDSVMFVDGVAVDSGATARVNAYTGWWRAGAGTRPTSGSNLPTTAGFRGQLDNVAVYPQELSAARVAAHYAAR